MVNENDRHIKCNFYEWIWSPFSRFISFEWSFLTELYVRTWIFWICNWLLANVTSFSKQEFEWAHKSFLNFFQTVKLITGIHKMTSNWTEWWRIIWYADIQKSLRILFVHRLCLHRCTVPSFQRKWMQQVGQTSTSTPSAVHLCMYWNWSVSWKREFNAILKI